MVRSLLPFPKHLVLAIGFLGLSVCGLEFGLHLHDACVPGTGSYSERNACAPSWTVHHLLKPDVRINATDPDTGAEVSWRTNSLGLRGAEIEIPKPVGTYRIVCLGDESTLAPETSPSETFCAGCGNFSRRPARCEIEVINAGCPQYGPLLSLLVAQTLALGPVARPGHLQFRHVRRRRRPSVPAFCADERVAAPVLPASGPRAAADRGGEDVGRAAFDVAARQARRWPICSEARTGPKMAAISTRRRGPMPGCATIRPTGRSTSTRRST